MQNEKKNCEKARNGRLELDAPVGTVDVAERTHQELQDDLKQENKPVHINVTLYQGDRAWLVRLAKAEGASLPEFCRRIMRNFLLSRPYMSNVELQVIRNCYRELCEVSTALTSNSEGINKLIEAGVVNECYREISENNQSLAEKVEALIAQVKSIIDQAETRAALERKWK